MQEIDIPFVFVNSMAWQKVTKSPDKNRSEKAAPKN